MNLFNKLRWLKPKPKTPINELSVDELTAGTLTATVRVVDQPTGYMHQTFGSDTVPAKALVGVSESHGKTVSWWGLVNGHVRPISLDLEAATTCLDGTVTLWSDDGRSYDVGLETLVHVSNTTYKQ